MIARTHVKEEYWFAVQGVDQRFRMKLEQDLTVKVQLLPCAAPLQTANYESNLVATLGGDAFDVM